MAADRDGVRRVLVDGTPITPTDLQVREIVSVEDDSVLVVASNVNEPTEQHGDAGRVRRNRSRT